jgi:hypothetical protein
MWSLDDCKLLLEDALARNETVVLACRCTVRYSGRAESRLEMGERIVLVKGDKTTLIHQPQGASPVNYMKPGASHALSVEDGRLILRATNLKEKESIEVVADRVYFFNSQKLEDGQSIVVTGTEDEMSDMLAEKPELIEKGFRPVKREEQTEYGYIDLLGYDAQGVLTVVECKRDCADHNAVMQLRRYVEKVKASKGIAQVRGIIAAPRITANAHQMLTDWGFSFVSVNPPKYYEEFDRKQARLDGFGQAMPAGHS